MPWCIPGLLWSRYLKRFTLSIREAEIGHVHPQKCICELHTSILKPIVSKLTLSWTLFIFNTLCISFSLLAVTLSLPSGVAWFKSSIYTHHNIQYSTFYIQSRFNSRNRGHGQCKTRHECSPLEPQSLLMARGPPRETISKHAFASRSSSLSSCTFWVHFLCAWSSLLTCRHTKNRHCCDSMYTALSSFFVERI